MNTLMAIGAAVAPALGLGLYAVSALGEVRGVHDWLVPAGARWRTRKPHLVLTFDDGPDPERTPRLLDLLAAAGTRATFFVMGERAEKHPELVARIAREGHALGNHSYSHPWMLFLSRRQIERQIDRCQEIVAGITGAAPTLARPPYGQRDFRYNQVARARGLTPVLWSCNPHDYFKPSPAVLLGRLRRARAGDVVLLHDGDPKATGTVEAVAAFLATRPALGLL